VARASNLSHTFAQDDGEAMTQAKRPGIAALVALTFAFISVLVFVDTPSAQADESLRCGTRLVSVGDVPYQVKSLCGIPDDVQQRTELRTVRRAVTVPCAAGFCQSMVEDTIQVNVEDWTYDFGAQRFIQYLTFANGKLVNVRSGGYGRKPAG
jgi:hypothetical protein